jgi:hypothetical protein
MTGPHRTPVERSHGFLRQETDEAPGLPLTIGAVLEQQRLSGQLRAELRVEPHVAADFHVVDQASFSA